MSFLAWAQSIVMTWQRHEVSYFGLLPPYSNYSFTPRNQHPLDVILSWLMWHLHVAWQLIINYFYYWQMVAKLTDHLQLIKIPPIDIHTFSLFIKREDMRCFHTCAYLMIRWCRAMHAGVLDLCTVTKRVVLLCFFVLVYIFSVPHDIWLLLLLCVQVLCWCPRCCCCCWRVLLRVEGLLQSGSLVCIPPLLNGKGEKLGLWLFCNSCIRCYRRRFFSYNIPFFLFQGLLIVWEWWERV